MAPAPPIAMAPPTWMKAAVPPVAMLGFKNAATVSLPVAALFTWSKYPGPAVPMPTYGLSRMIVRISLPVELAE